MNVKLHFDYSLPVRGISYKLGLNNSDTVFIKSSSPPQPERSYMRVLNVAQRSKFHDLMAALDLSKLDTVYESHDIDGEEYRLSITKNDTTKSIYIHNSHITGQIKDLTDWLINFKASADRSVSQH